MYDEKTNKSKGYGFVHYETEEEAYKAINSANGKQIASKIVYIKYLLIYFLQLFL
jgi:RNA recognition motif-containing protein